MDKIKDSFRWLYDYRGAVMAVAFAIGLFVAIEGWLGEMEERTHSISNSIQRVENQNMLLLFMLMYQNSEIQKRIGLEYWGHRPYII